MQISVRVDPALAATLDAFAAADGVSRTQVIRRMTRERRIRVGPVPIHTREVLRRQLNEKARMLQAESPVTGAIRDDAASVASEGRGMLGT
jgi:hypothetical protein